LRAFTHLSAPPQRNESERARKVTIASKRTTMRETQSSLSSAHPSPHRGPPSGAPISRAALSRAHACPKDSRAAPKDAARAHTAFLAVSKYTRRSSRLSAEEFLRWDPVRNEALSVSSSPRLRTQFSLDSDQVSEFRRAHAIRSRAGSLSLTLLGGAALDFYFHSLCSEHCRARETN
jgi:hypothetical protein